MSIKLFIKSRIDPDFNLADELPFPTEVKKFIKHDKLTCYGKVEHCAYFLLSGNVKISMLREDGQERILEFFFPNSFFSSYTSFLTQEASGAEIEALEDCVVEMIKFEDMQAAYKHSLLANKLGRMVAEHYYIWKTNREKAFLVNSASERYQYLVNSRPEVIQNIPINLIAKYLGIEPESLSRIRKSLM